MRFRSCITALFLTLLMMLGISCTAIGQPGAAQSNTVQLQAFSEGEGPPIIMLGGGTFGAAAFAPHAKILAKQFRVVRLQALNVEKSQEKEQLPPGYSVKLESAAMTRALDELGITTPIHLVGQSFGALIALDFAWIIQIAFVRSYCSSRRRFGRYRKMSCVNLLICGRCMS